MEGGSGIPSGGSNIAPCAMLGLEMPLHHHKQQQQLLSFSNHSREAENNRHPPQAIRPGGYGTNFNVSGSGRGKQQQQQPSLSSEEEALPAGPEAAGGDGTKRIEVGQTQTASPWQRMKWTDSMIRLLIMVVYCVGDDIGADGGGDTQHAAVGKGKKAASSAGQLQQKKGKWKSVSRAMMERGYCVSPQQCEDKFNDLNKRYKRVNDLLGRGTACLVVENQSLLDSMDNLSPKAKEEARKLLNSKHLFFREMCAYHTSCTAAAASAASLPSATAAPDHFHDQQAPHVLVAPAAVAAPATGDTGHQLMEMERDRHDDEDDADNEVEGEDDYNDEYLDDEDDEDEDEGDHRARHRHSHHHYKHEERERERLRDRDADDDTKGATTSMGGLVAGTKRPRRLSLGLPSASSASSPLSLSLSSPSSASTSMQRLRSELMGLANGGVSEQHQKHWLKNRALELEEQQVHLQSRALELERQRFKWLRFSSNKERELEKAKIENERLRLENERMLLLLRQKELQLINASDTVTFLASTSDAQQQQQQHLLSGNYKRSADHHPYPL